MDELNVTENALYINDNFLKAIYKMNDAGTQVSILQEECAELIQAISKLRRGKENAMDMVKEEIAHVAMSSLLAVNILGITQKDIDNEINRKAEKHGLAAACYQGVKPTDDESLEECKN